MTINIHADDDIKPCAWGYCHTCEQDTWHDHENDCWGVGFSNKYPAMWWDMFYAPYEKAQANDRYCHYNERHADNQPEPDRLAWLYSGSIKRHGSWERAAAKEFADSYGWFLHEREFIINEAIHLERS